MDRHGCFSPPTWLWHHHGRTHGCYLLLRRHAIICICKRQGLVPDYLVTLPQGLEALMELKVIGSGPTHYAGDDVRKCFAVEGRARTIPSEYRSKAL